MMKKKKILLKYKMRASRRDTYETDGEANEKAKN